MSETEQDTITIDVVTMDDSGELHGSALNEDEKSAWNTEMERLWSWNKICGILHLVQGLFIFTISFTNSNANNMMMPVTSLFQNWDTGAPVQALGLVTRITYVRFASYFALLSAAAHFAILWKWDVYTRDLAKGKQIFRWYEYSLSSSLIICLLYMIWGNFDFVQVSGVFMINWCTIMFGAEFEALNFGKKANEVDWTAFIYGALCGQVTWWILWYKIVTAADLSAIPIIAWVYIISYQIFFFSFPWNMWNQYRQNGAWNNELYLPNLKNGGYLYGERTYQILSLTSKSFLVWMIAFAFKDESSVIWGTIGSTY